MPNEIQTSAFLRLSATRQADCQLVDADEMARAVRRLFLAVAEIRDTPRSSGDAAAKETQEREGRHRRRAGKAARDLQHRQPS